MMCLRDRPFCVGRGPIGLNTLVAITTSSRRASCLMRPPEHRLARTEAVHVGRIEEVDARFPGFAEERQGRGLVQHPFAPARVAVGHAAQA